MSDLIGRSLNNRYQILELLGEGGMGSVYRAHDPTLSRDVAVKVMHGRFADRDEFQDRFLQEARTAARLSHPGIVQVYDQGQADGKIFIVMEMIRGGNLDQMIRQLRNKQQWISLAEAIELTRQVALALDHAHRQGVLHRDIKPANIMVKDEPRPEGSRNLPYRPVVTDFGLAKLAEGGIQTLAGSTMGTPAYMSPEQTMGEELDARSDIYSLGILLYELAVGQVPFRIRTLTEAMRYHTREQPPRPSQLRPDLPESVEKIILTALAKDPSQRYESAGALAEALRRLPSEDMLESIPPTAVGAGSILTQFRESLVDLRGSSLIAQRSTTEREQRAAAPTFILISPSDRLPGATGQDSEQYTVPLLPRLTVGRGDENNLQLRDGRISRQHAIIEVVGAEIWVTDLGSTNGTHLGRDRLQARVRTRWDPRLPLQMGDHRLLLQSAPTARTLEGTLERTMERTGERTPTPPPLRQGVEVKVDPPEVRVRPGDAVGLNILLQNHGAEGDQFYVAATGIPGAWFAAPFPTIPLAAGERRVITFTFSPPRSPQTEPRRYPVTIQVSGLKTPGRKFTASSALNILPYAQFHSIVTQQSAGGEERLQIELENQGNAPGGYRLIAEDTSGALYFEPPTATMRVDRGGRASFDIGVRPLRRSLIGTGKRHTFQLRVMADSGETEAHNSVFVSRPIVPVWASLLMLVLFVGMIGGASVLLRPRIIDDLVAFFNPGGFSGTTGGSGTPTSIITPTPTLSSAAATQTADFVDGTQLPSGGIPAEVEATQTAEVAKATQDAGATATWLAADDDRDELSNGEEMARGTNPSRIDSDGDGLPDGAELRLDTDPMNPDTDGDGLLDGTDEAPLQTSTPTPTETPTAPPTATFTPTPVPPTATHTPTPVPPTATFTPTPVPPTTTFTPTPVPPTATFTPTPRPPTATFTPIPPPTPTFTPRPPTPTQPVVFPAPSGPCWAEPQVIQAGQTATLRWSFNANTTRVFVENIEFPGREGRHDVRPTETKSYRLLYAQPTSEGQEQFEFCDVTVVVN